MTIERTDASGLLIKRDRRLGIAAHHGSDVLTAVILGRRGWPRTAAPLKVASAVNEASQVSPALFASSNCFASLRISPRPKSRSYRGAGRSAGEVAIVQARLLLGISAAPAATLLVTLPPFRVLSDAILLPSFSYRTLALFVSLVFAPGAAARFGTTALEFWRRASYLE